MTILHSSTDPVIYGLVDPREPERVRYVGKAAAVITTQTEGTSL